LGVTESTMSEAAKENWGSGGAYDLWVGRWSRLVAEKFIDWLAVSSGQTWGDVGCGTGALVECILGSADPADVFGVDRSEAYVSDARNRVRDSRACFEVGDACALTWAAATCDVTVSGLVLNFVPDSDAMVREMVRVTRPGGRVAAYVWDYAGGMQMIRHFWDAAVELNRGDSKLDQAERFPLCQPGPLEQLFRRAGLISVSVRAIEVPTVFRDFEDYWRPFLGKQGAAPTYLASLPGDTRDRIRDALKARLVGGIDCSIAMTARAWAVQGTVTPNPSLHRTCSGGLGPPARAGEL
jgi:SAM-dependent methyltransferase